MKPSQFGKWVLGFIALAAIYVTVAKVAPRLMKSQPPIKPGDIIHQHDADELALVLPEGGQLDVIRIVAGDFMMGSPETEVGRDPSESPQHKVYIAHDFYLGKFDVTQAQWMKVMGKNQSNFQGDVNLPAEQVSWDDCQEFCKRVSAKNGRKVRLPTEAEWEFACRAGGTTVFSEGDTFSSLHANFNGLAPYGAAEVGPARGKTTPVNTFPPNALGLYDMQGNVWQWCQDVFHPTYDGAPHDGSAWETGEDPDVHVFRGGSYNNDGAVCRAATRWANGHNTRGSTIGFRVAADLTDDQ